MFNIRYPGVHNAGSVITNCNVLFSDISVKDCQILDFCGGKLTVLVDSHLIVQLVVNETKPWEIVYTIECPSKVLHASATGNILAVVDSDHSICILLICIHNISEWKIIPHWFIISVQQGMQHFSLVYIVSILLLVSGLINIKCIGLLSPQLNISFWIPFTPVAIIPEKEDFLDIAS